MILQVLVGLLVCSVSAPDQGKDDFSGGRLDPTPISVSTPKTLQATFRKVKMNSGEGQRSNRGTCPDVQVALTDSNFGNGSYIMQAGFAQGESLGATYSVPANEFPIKINLMEVLFAAQTNIQTTTHWSVSVWDGTPTNGIPIVTYSSDNIILPHLVMPPGTNGTIISVSVDPSDPDQIYIYNDSGMNSFTITFRIDQHNSPGTPCISAPPSNANAFPVTDMSGLQFPNENWIDAIAGPFCACGSGWMTFQQFPGFCTPSGDWVMRASYSSLSCTIDPIACCFSDNSCQELTPSDCDIFGGVSAGVGTSCATYICGSGVGACCVASTGNCVEFTAANCAIVGGTHMGEGVLCADTTCFPVGACCLATGSCIGPVSPEDCVAVAGIFQGDSTSCATSACPQPNGACCGPTWCLDLPDSDCIAVGGIWNGQGTACSDQGACAPACPEDLDGDGFINVNDLLTVVGDWGSTTSNADISGNGVVDTADLLAVIAAWGTC